MTTLLSKRIREDEPLQAVSPKRFRTEEEFLCLLEEEDRSFEEECVESEEVVGRGDFEEEIEEIVDGGRNLDEEIEDVVNGVMRSLEEEIGLTCSSSDFEGSGTSSGPSTDQSMAPNVNHSCEIDVGYLLEASDDELGLPPSPLLDSAAYHPASPSLDESSTSCLDFPQNAELRSFFGNWQFEDDFVDYSQFSEDAEASAWDIFNPAAFFDGDYSLACRLEASGGLS